VEITWDDLKEAENVKKHGVEFGEAATVIYNPLSLFKPNKHRSGKRFEYLGHSDRIKFKDEFKDTHYFITFFGSIPEFAIRHGERSDESWDWEDTKLFRKMKRAFIIALSVASAARFFTAMMPPPTRISLIEKTGSSIE
jgi:uncharacterized DUF497 family protein